MQFEQLWRATTVAARGQEFDSTLLIGIAIGSALTLFSVFIILSFHIDRLYLPPKQPTNDRLYRPPPTAVAACSDETQHADGGDDAARRTLGLLRGADCEAVGGARRARVARRRARGRAGSGLCTS